jgi:hypothetical protein
VEVYYFPSSPRITLDMVRQWEAAAASPPQDKPVPAVDYFDRLLAWADKPGMKKTVGESSNA